MPLTITEVNDLLDILESNTELRYRLVKTLFPDVDVQQTFRRLTGMLERLENRVEAGFAEAKVERETGFAEAKAEREAGFAEAKVERETGFAEAKVERETGFAEAKAEREAGFAEAKAEREAGFAEAKAERETGFAEAKAEREAGFAEAKAERDIIRKDIAILKGRSQEQFYQQNADAIFGRYLRRGKRLAYEIADQLQTALENEQITEAEFVQVMAADLLWGGRSRTTGEDVILVLEASWLAQEEDVTRAVTRAAILRRIGLPALPIVGGQEWLEEAWALAEEQKAIIVSNGRIEATTWKTANISWAANNDLA